MNAYLPSLRRLPSALLYLTLLLLIGPDLSARVVAYGPGWTMPPPPSASVGDTITVSGAGRGGGKGGSRVAIYLKPPGRAWLLLAEKKTTQMISRDLTVSASFHVDRSGIWDLRIEWGGWLNGYQSAVDYRSVSAAAANVAPEASLSGSTSLTTGQPGTWNFGVSDANGNLREWRFRSSTDPGAGWSQISGSSTSGSHTQSFDSPGTYTWIVEVYDGADAYASTSLDVEVIAAEHHIATHVSPAGAGSVWGGGTYTRGHTAWLTSSASPGYTFSGWSGDLSGSGNPQSLVVDRDKSVTAHFSENSYSVTPSVSPAGAGSVAGGGSYRHGEAASLTAAPASGYTFTGWSGDLNGTTNPQSLTVDGPKAVTANFALNHYTLSVAVVGSGVASGAGSYAHGQTATVTATPEEGWSFAGFSGAITSGSSPGSVVMTGDRSITARFVRNSYTLSTSATSGGSVTPGGTYPHGTTVTVSAAPNASSRFVGWAGDATGTSPSIAVTMNGPRSVQAVFMAKTAQTISFPDPGDRSVGEPAFPLGAAASSGLPVSYTLLTGPGMLMGDQLLITGPGTLTLQASQPGDGFYLPAPTVTHTFNGVAPAMVRYQAATRLVLQSDETRAAPLVLEAP